MSHEEPESDTFRSDARRQDISSARKQVEDARQRRQRLIEIGRLGSRAGEMLAGKRLPGYSLLREVHRGGQGVVYLATQESTGRPVAVKIMRRGPLGGPPSNATARFEREVDVLSRLKHPNIVTIHDCGRDHEDVYLVMDYVHGRPLDVYVAGNRLPIPEILSLFARICDGVSAAHLRGVIHRDLKPSNILVDEHGQPHVLDFGLAKFADDAVDPASDGAATRTGHFVGSLPWASPEQADGRPDQLDVRTDVYSLGVLLYQVLTRRFPYPVAGPLSEVARHIRQTDPVRPSTYERAIDRDLETILLKALSKQPERRYQSAGELARDLRRYLTGEPIEARRDSLAYLMAKQIARYRRAVIAGATTLVAVIAALIVSTVFWRHAEQQRALADQNALAAQRSAERADLEASQARAITNFLHDILTSVDPENRGADVRLIDVLRSASDTASQRFAGHPQHEALIRDLLGQVYFKLSLWNQARSELAQALDLWTAAVGPNDPRTLTVESGYANVLLNLEQTDAADRVLQSLLPRLERTFGPQDRRVLIARRDLAIIQVFRNQLDDAERMLLDLRAHPTLVDDDEMQIRVLAGLVSIVGRRISTEPAESLDALLADGETWAREWVERAQRWVGADSMIAEHARTRVNDLVCKQGRCEEAAEASRRILDRTDPRLGDCHYIRTTALFTLAEALSQLGDHAQAAELVLRRIECDRELLSVSSPPLYLSMVSDSLRYLDHGGRAAEGESLARELSQAMRSFAAGHVAAAFSADLYVAHFVSVQNRLAEAEPLFDGLREQESRAEDARLRARLHLYYAGHLTRCERYADAEAELLAAVKLLGDLGTGTWDSHPDDVIRGFINLYEALGRPAVVREFQWLAAGLRR